MYAIIYIMSNAAGKIGDKFKFDLKTAKDI
jgi:hypothetical protein